MRRRGHLRGHFHHFGYFFSLISYPHTHFAMMAVKLRVAAIAGTGGDSDFQVGWTGSVDYTAGHSQ